ncbi:hypothetical protein [Blautia pseudococcoides]
MTLYAWMLMNFSANDLAKSTRRLQVEKLMDNFTDKELALH